MTDCYEITMRVPHEDMTPEKLKTWIAKAATQQEINVKSVGIKHVKTGGKKAKAKGSSFERDMAKALGKWWWGKPFRRTPGSGAWDKLAQDGKVLALGDIYAEKEAEFPFCVECKKVGELWNMINPAAIMDKWWDKVETEAKDNELLPLLIIGFDRRESYVVYDGEDLMVEPDEKNARYVLIGERITIQPLDEWLNSGMETSDGRLLVPPLYLRAEGHREEDVRCVI